MAVGRPALSLVLLFVTLGAHCGFAEWTEEQCTAGIGNIATEARACQEQAAGAGREISGELVRGEPVCSQVSFTAEMTAGYAGRTASEASRACRKCKPRWTLYLTSVMVRGTGRIIRAR